MLFLFLFSVLLGLVLGSFLNLCLDRIPLVFQDKLRAEQLHSPQASSVLKQHLKQKTLSISTPARSFCFSCGHTLFWYENIPVFSCLLNQARCRQCGSFYGWRTFYVEAGVGVFFAVISLLF